jgi:hypothetical protein
MDSTSRIVPLSVPITVHLALPIFRSLLKETLGASNCSCQFELFIHMTCIHSSRENLQTYTLARTESVYHMTKVFWVSQWLYHAVPSIPVQFMEVTPTFLGSLGLTVKMRSALDKNTLLVRNTSCDTGYSLQSELIVVQPGVRIHILDEIFHV